MAEDAEAAADLSGELGYRTSAEEMRGRIERITRKDGQTVLVACVNEEVVGWIEVDLCLHLQSEPHAVVGGLVVREDMRNHGIGRQLLLQGEEWSRKQGVHVVRVRSQIARSDAHRFYLREGYKQVKTSAVFEKSV